MPTFALNFYSPVVADQLRTGRKTATIRLGDKSAKYRKGMIVTVLVVSRSRDVSGMLKMSSSRVLSFRQKGSQGSSFWPHI